MTVTRTTLSQEQIDTFFDEVSYWVKSLGLIGWELHYDVYDSTEDAEQIETVDANCYYLPSDRQATISLSPAPTFEPTTFGLSRVAFHECCHLFLCRLTSAGDDDVNMSYEHEIIRVLENTLFEKDFYSRYTQTGKKRTNRKD